MTQPIWKLLANGINSSRDLIELEIWCITIQKSKMRKGHAQLKEVLLQKESELQEQHTECIQKTIRKLIY